MMFVGPWEPAILPFFRRTGGLREPNWMDEFYAAKMCRQGGVFKAFGRLAGSAVDRVCHDGT
jgi:hypothetical protein